MIMVGTGISESDAIVVTDRYAAAAAAEWRGISF
jgi:hypothetical protein